MQIRLKKDCHFYRTLPNIRHLAHNVIKETESLYWVVYQEREYGIPKEDCKIVEEEPIKPILKPFTFEEWDKDRSQPVWTSNEAEVKQLTYFENVAPSSWPLVGIVNKQLSLFTEEGKSVGDYILMLESKEKEYYVNVYKHGSGYVYMGEIRTKEGCEQHAKMTTDTFIMTISFKC